MKGITIEWIAIGEGDWETAGREYEAEPKPNYRSVCFHCQQCGEKYLKAVIQENGNDPRRTHDLEILLDEVLSIVPEWTGLRDACLELTDFAVAYRYPGTVPTKENADAALVYASEIRVAVRNFFDLDHQP